MTKFAYEYECALSGLHADGGVPYAADGLEDMPPGWTEVRLSRRRYNPRWVAIQQVKKAMVERLMAQFPEAAQTQGQQMTLHIQVEAQFRALENDTPMYLTDVETVYLAPPETAEEVAEAYNQARELLGLDPFEPIEGPESEDSEHQGEEDEEDEEDDDSE